jgi:flagellar hook-length control protein FliK
MDLGLGEGIGREIGENAFSGNAGKDVSFSSRFEDALARELRGGLSTDIVRDAAIIVKNGGEGIIRLSLRPASLGDVKIRIEMTENKITGHIIVESNDAFRAFERELPVLEKAFRDSGFSETNLDMSLASENSADGRNFGAGRERQEADIQSVSSFVAASNYENGSDWQEASIPEGMVSFAGIPGTRRTPVNILV